MAAEPQRRTPRTRGFTRVNVGEIVARGIAAIGRKTGGDQRLVELTRLADPARLPISEGRPTAKRAPMRGQRGGDHCASDRHPRFGDAHADAKEEMAVHEVGRAVERIAIPSEPVAGRRRAALFLADDGDLRACARRAAVESSARSPSRTQSPDPRGPFREPSGCLRKPACKICAASLATSNAICASSSGDRSQGCASNPARRQASTPWHFLYFLPLPHGHGSLRPTRGSVRRTGGPFSSTPSTKNHLPSSFLKVARSRWSIFIFCSL